MIARARAPLAVFTSRVSRTTQRRLLGMSERVAPRAHRRSVRTQLVSTGRRPAVALRWLMRGACVETATRRSPHEVEHGRRVGASATVQDETPRSSADDTSGVTSGSASQELECASRRTYDGPRSQTMRPVHSPPSEERRDVGGLHRFLERLLQQGRDSRTRACHIEATVSRMRASRCSCPDPRTLHRNSFWWSIMPPCRRSGSTGQGRRGEDRVVKVCTTR